MVRLPIVNSDDGTWGDILRDFIMKEHLNDDNASTPTNGGHHKITIAPGTASAGTAPITFTTGTLLTTPEAGAMEFAGDHYYLTTASGTRKKIATYDEGSPGATGDLYYRNSSGYFTRLPVGSEDQVLTVNGSGLPTWQDTAVPSGFVVDEDNMASNSSTQVPTQQSVKAYVDSGLAGKANTSHTHTISNVTGLQTALDGKAATSHTHSIANVTNLQSTLDGKAATSHTHTASQISDSTSIGRSVLTAASAAAARSAIGAGTGNVSGSNNGTPTALTLWTGTLAQYEALGSYDSNTVYIVT